MKELYINSRLHPLLIERSGTPARQWIHSAGEPWLLLTPGRLAALALRLGKGDGRIQRLLGLLRRHSAEPELFCRRLGVRESRYLSPADYPVVVCPRCEGLHAPHPEEAGMVCRQCREREGKDATVRPTAGQIRDRQADRLARRVLAERDPGSFYEGMLSPNFRYNLKRRLHRDWDRAINRILMGGTYRQVSREFNCSVGLLHKKVREHRAWENN